MASRGQIPWNKGKIKSVTCGHGDRPHFARGMCRSCYAKNRFLRTDVKAKHLQYQRTPKARAAAKKSQATYRARPEVKAALLINGAKWRADEKHLPFDLDRHAPEIVARLNRGCCEMSGLLFDFRSAGRTPNSPSIDRIRPELGYTYANIRFILWCLNVAFGDWGEETTFQIMRAAMRQPDLRVYSGTSEDSPAHSHVFPPFFVVAPG